MLKLLFTVLCDGNIYMTARLIYNHVKSLGKMTIDDEL